MIKLKILKIWKPEISSNKFKALKDDLKDLQAKISNLKNEHDVIINNLTKKVDELQVEKGFTDLRQNSDLERSCEKCGETFATEVNLKEHLDTKHEKVIIQMDQSHPIKSK